jgi:FtsH-binding integral membrane protein
MFVEMKITEFFKKTMRWLWPSLLIMVLSCIRKTVLESSNFDHIQNGLLLYAGYLLCIIPLGTFLSKSKWLDDTSKTALMVLFMTYIYIEYSILSFTWQRYAGHWVEQCLYNKQDTVFILMIVIFGFTLMWLLRRLNDKRKNRALLLFTIIVLAIFPFVDFLLTPNYKFDSDLFNIQQSNIAVNPTAIPQRIFWIILDEHPSSMILNEAWGYNDTTFRRGLESLGFTVYDSCVSNYNSTYYSIAATTYGAMLKINRHQILNAQRRNLLAAKIQQSPVIAFFRAQGYIIHNLSIFDPDSKKYFMHQGKIVNSSIVGMLISKFDNQYSMSQVLYNRTIVDSLNTLLKFIPNNDQRIFVYAHVIMPHGPYLPLTTNSTQRNSPLLDPANDKAFLRHVRYTDSTILNLMNKGVTNLSPEQRSKTVVILQADHGYRYLQNRGKYLQLKSSFGILNAILMPKNSKTKYYNGMSSVNTFRILFRDLWGIRLHTLKDSSVDVCQYAE